MRSNSADVHWDVHQGTVHAQLGKSSFDHVPEEKKSTFFGLILGFEVTNPFFPRIYTAGMETSRCVVSSTIDMNSSSFSWS